MLAGFSGTHGSGDTSSSNTGYLSPIQNVQLPWDVTYIYKYSIILGYVSDIRSTVYDLHNSGIFCTHTKKK